ncbi:MAG: SusD/RagB family nutrient-binding outer membrane lipoprotein [Bacteroidota bacterium]|nr:SusD/RagB family nutrient-binding outer membrane lipoprotein [Bacteroidota bacterium]
MKTIKIKIIIVFALLFQLTSCLDLNELNVDPNNPVNVSSNYILTYVLTGTAKTYKSLGDHKTGVAGVMQYNQMGTNDGMPEVNQYLWTAGSWAGYYDLLRNVEIINKKSITEGNKFFEAISLTLRAFLFGTLTDLFGDIPYSESLQATQGIYFSKYDDQKNIYKGVLEDLKNAESILGDAGIINYKIAPSADLMYAGDAAKWRKFANSLRLRYCMRLINKKTDMNAIGVDLVAEFNAASAQAFVSNSDDAVVNYLGTTASNSAKGGLLNTSNPEYQTKPCKTIVDKLKTINDPRLHRWAIPVQTKWDFNVSTEKDVIVKNWFGETFTVKIMPTTNTSLDTSLYVGMPANIALFDAQQYNKGNGPTFPQPERSPYISYLHSRFRANSDPYIKMDLMMYSEVEFLLAEAAQRGGFSVSGPEGHYKNGILASMKRWGITDGANGFNFNTYYSNSKVSYSGVSNTLERIIEQKWISSWLNVESWFDYRRTGYPALVVGPVTQYGKALPLRFMYPVPSQDPKYLVNYNEAVNKLETTSFVPTGQSKDHTYSRMWLLQGTGKPW